MSEEKIGFYKPDTGEADSTNKEQTSGLIRLKERVSKVITSLRDDGDFIARRVVGPSIMALGFYIGANNIADSNREIAEAIRQSKSTTKVEEEKNEPKSEPENTEPL